MVAVSGEGAWQVTTPLLPRTFTGAGDLTAATFLASYLRTRDVAASVAHTAAVVHGVLDVTVASGQAVVADATEMLGSLVRRVDRDPGTAIAAQQPETMDLTGVQQYLGETGPVDGATSPLPRDEGGSADR